MPMAVTQTRMPLPPAALADAGRAGLSRLMIDPINQS